MYKLYFGKSIKTVFEYKHIYIYINNFANNDEKNTVLYLSNFFFYGAIEKTIILFYALQTVLDECRP